MKKILALILALIMLMSVAAPAVYATDVITQTPVIFIRGASRYLYESDDVMSDETQIFPLNVDLGEHLSNVLKPCLEELAKGVVTDNYDAYCDELYNACAPLYEDVILDKNGEASDGSGDGTNVYKFDRPRKSKNFGLWDYDFGFDLRLSPLEIADDLKIYIDLVKEATGKDKVAIVGRCFGGNVVSAYLEKYKEHAIENVESVIMYISSTAGVDSIGALFAGEIKLDADNVDRFVEYVSNDMGVIEDKDMQSLITASVDLLNYAKVLGIGTDTLQYIVDKVKDNLVPRLALASYGTFPSYWSMVPTKYFEKAKAMIFSGKEEEYAGLIEKIDAYYNTVQLNYEDTMKYLDSQGVKISVVSKYNLPVLPLYDGADAQSDFIAETRAVSFGATTAKLDKTLSTDYINSLEDTRYISPDLKIDASTCLFPDKSWFIKDLYHFEFPDSCNYLLGAIIEYGQLTVFDNELYPQYIAYDVETDTISPVTGTDPERPAEGSGEERFSIMIRFFTAIMNFFTKLFNGEFSFGNLFGGDAE